MDCINSETLSVINEDLIEVKSEQYFDNYEENDRNLYTIENHFIYYKNHLIIGRIVYECYQCIYVCNNINDSINHYINKHLSHNNCIEKSCEGIDSNIGIYYKLMTENDNNLQNYVNNNMNTNMSEVRDENRDKKLNLW